MFVAVAAAGMLASCSSDSLTAGPDPNIEPTQEERVPIQLGVSAPSVNLASGTTRGTGTVGGVGVTNDDPTNVWYGQKINAFMFVKNSLDLAVENETGPVYFYNDAVMITPGTADNQIPGLSTPTNIGEAMLSNGDIKYYPGSGNFDFFGYHGAGVTSNLTKTDGLWTVDFTIDGSQDLMSTKAVLTDAQTAKMGGSTDFYSAKAARKEVQPILSFNHLLTRLAFEVKAGNDNAGGWVAGTHNATTAADYNATLAGHHAATEELSAEEAATYNSKLPGALQAGVALDATQLAAYNSAIDPDKSEGDELTTDEANAYNATLGGALSSGTPLDADEAIAYNATLPGAVKAGDPDPFNGSLNPTLAVYVKSIEVKSKTKGKMDVAWTGNTPGELITWDEATAGTPAWLKLQERPFAFETADATNLISEAVYNSLPLYYKNSDKSVRITPAEYATLPADAFYYLISNPATTITPAAYGLLDDEEKALYAEGDSQDNHTELTAANCTLTGASTNYNLVALTPTRPVLTKTTKATTPDDPTTIGEALIVAPSTEAYQMKVLVSQEVKTNWDGTTDVKEQTYDLEIPVPTGGFLKNTSYKVVLTVYGFERIEVTTEIIPWTQGATIPVGQD